MVDSSSRIFADLLCQVVLVLLAQPVVDEAAIVSPVDETPAATASTEQVVTLRLVARHTGYALEWSAPNREGTVTSPEDIASVASSWPTQTATLTVAAEGVSYAETMRWRLALAGAGIESTEIVIVTGSSSRRAAHDAP